VINSSLFLKGSLSTDTERATTSDERQRIYKFKFVSFYVGINAAKNVTILYQTPLLS
jgi:hypothetical protein